MKSTNPLIRLKNGRYGAPKAIYKTFEAERLRGLTDCLKEFALAGKVMVLPYSYSRGNPSYERGWNKATSILEDQRDAVFNRSQEDGLNYFFKKNESSNFNP